MLEQILKHLRNWFCVRIESGKWTIADGEIALPSALSGQYFRITGSVFNDGLYKYPATGMTDETFEGNVWLLAIPKDIIDLSDEIETWCNENAVPINSAYTSESFGGYSYSINADGNGHGWENHFKARLNPWRKL